MNEALIQTAGCRPDRPLEAFASEWIRRYLRGRPTASPAELAEWLAQCNIRLAPQVIDALLAAMKTG